jgi:hypothetical protein
MGKIGKRVGGVIRNTARSMVSLWHKLTPFINRLGKAFFKEVGPLGLAIITKAVRTAIERGLKGEDARQVAIQEIQKEFEASKIEVRARAINWVLETMFNKEAGTV